MEYTDESLCLGLLLKPMVELLFRTARTTAKFLLGTEVLTGGFGGIFFGGGAW